MKAIHLTAYGNPAENLKLVEVSEPNAPSAGEALVRMEYAPIAYSDLLLAEGIYLLHPNLPSVIGGEGAGIVEAMGPGVTSVKVGDRVTIPFGTFTWSEKVLALLTTFRMGSLLLPNRVVMAPLTRQRAANPGHVPTKR